MTDISARHGEVRRLFERMAAGDGATGTPVERDDLMCGIILYGIAEGYARASGRPPKNPDRFHEGDTLPRGLDGERLLTRAVEVYESERALDNATVELAERIALGHGNRLFQGLPALRQLVGMRAAR